MSDWLQYRQNDLRERLNTIANKERLSVVQPYFPFDDSIEDVDVFYADDTHFARHPDFTCDVFFGQGNRIDVEKLLAARRTGRVTLCANWFWDNHHLYSECMHIAMLTDVYFFGHSYKSAYLKNELSLEGGFVPMLSIAWTRQQIERASSQFILGPRSDALYGGYNSYVQFSHRDRIIEEVRSAVPNNAVFMTPHGTPPAQHPYNRLTSEERLAEWMRYKVCLCVSVDRDITMRMFDTLLTGGIPLLVGRPDDLDQVIPPDMQALLPVVVVDSKDPRDAAAAYEACIAAFDRGGPDGVLTRHSYARDNHMPQNRLAQMVARIRAIARTAGQAPE